MTFPPLPTKDVSCRPPSSAAPILFHIFKTDCGFVNVEGKILCTLGTNSSFYTSVEEEEDHIPNQDVLIIIGMCV